MKQDEEFSIQILGHEWVLQPRQGFGGVLQRTLPKELKDMTQRYDHNIACVQKTASTDN